MKRTTGMFKSRKLAVLHIWTEKNSFNKNAVLIGFIAHELFLLYILFILNN